MQLFHNPVKICSKLTALKWLINLHPFSSICLCQAGLEAYRCVLVGEGAVGMIHATEKALTTGRMSAANAWLRVYITPACTRAQVLSIILGDSLTQGQYPLVLRKRLLEGGLI